MPFQWKISWKMYFEEIKFSPNSTYTYPSLGFFRWSLKFWGFLLSLNIKYIPNSTSLQKYKDIVLIWWRWYWWRLFTAWRLETGDTGGVATSVFLWSCVEDGWRFDERKTGLTTFSEKWRSWHDQHGTFQLHFQPSPTKQQHTTVQED